MSTDTIERVAFFLATTPIAFASAASAVFGISVNARRRPDHFPNDNPPRSESL